MKRLLSLTLELSFRILAESPHPVAPAVEQVEVLHEPLAGHLLGHGGHPLGKIVWRPRAGHSRWRLTATSLFLEQSQDDFGWLVRGKAR